MEYAGQPYGNKTVKCYNIAFVELLKSYLHYLKTVDGIGSICIESRTLNENSELQHIYYSFLQNGSVYFSKQDFDKHLSSVGSLPIPLIFPPQYRAQVVTVIGRNEQVMLNYFDRNLLAEDRSLQLNIAGNTNIRTANGQQFNCNPAEQTLLVYYTATTRSIPPQTTPSRIIVFC